MGPRDELKKAVSNLTGRETASPDLSAWRVGHVGTNPHGPFVRPFPFFSSHTTSDPRTADRGKRLEFQR
jgi:hypothetical protein